MFQWKWDEEAWVRRRQYRCRSVARGEPHLLSIRIHLGAMFIRRETPESPATLRTTENVNFRNGYVNLASTCPMSYWLLTRTEPADSRFGSSEGHLSALGARQLTEMGDGIQTSAICGGSQAERSTTGVVTMRQLEPIAEISLYD
jgi:hypothetical protein